MTVCTHSAVTTEATYSGIELKRCPSCGLIFQTAPQESAVEHYSTYYKSEGGRFGFITELVVKFFRAWRAITIRVHYGRPIISCLDIGCGRGYTLYFLKNWFGVREVVGIQPSAPAAAFAKQKLGLNIIEADFAATNLPPHSFEVVTLWHVLEHLPDPAAALRKIYGLMPSDGRLFIEVPNYNSWSRRWAGEYWLGLDLQNHLCFFTPQSLMEILTAVGFEITKQRTFSLEYSTPFSVDSLAGKLSGQQYGLLRFLENQQWSFKMAVHILLVLVLVIPCFLINLILTYTKRGEVISVVAKKKP